MGKITTFTTEEIRELEMKPSDLVKEKIAATGNQEALEAFEQYVGLFMGVHDGYLLQCHTAECALFNEVGPDKYQEYMYPYFYNANKPMIEGYWDKPFKERCIAAINGPRMFHDCKMKILGEDDKKLWFVMDPCGAGQKLWDMGCYAEGSGGAFCSAHPITSGRDHFPVYCCHAPLGEIAANDLGSTYIYQQDYPEQTGPCSCVFNVYKKEADIPDKYYERIGRKRP